MKYSVHYRLPEGDGDLLPTLWCSPHLKRENWSGITRRHTLIKNTSFSTHTLAKFYQSHLTSLETFPAAYAAEMEQRERKTSFYCFYKLLSTTLLLSVAIISRLRTIELWNISPSSHSDHSDHSSLPHCSEQSVVQLNASHQAINLFPPASGRIKTSYNESSSGISEDLSNHTHLHTGKRSLSLRTIRRHFSNFYLFIDAAVRKYSELSIILKQFQKYSAAMWSFWKSFCTSHPFAEQQNSHLHCHCRQKDRTTCAL